MLIVGSETRSTAVHPRPAICLPCVLKRSAPWLAGGAMVVPAGQMCSCMTGNAGSQTRCRGFPFASVPSAEEAKGLASSRTNASRRPSTCFIEPMSSSKKVGHPTTRANPPDVCIGSKAPGLVRALRRFPPLLANRGFLARILDGIQHRADVGLMRAEIEPPRELGIRLQFAGLVQRPHLFAVMQHVELRREEGQRRAQLVDVAQQHRARMVVAGG